MSEPVNERAPRGGLALWLRIALAIAGLALLAWIVALQSH
jgi:hypothetical protein